MILKASRTAYSALIAQHSPLALALCAVLSALSSPAAAQKVPRIGFLIASSPSAMAPRLDAFQQGLRELGYVDGKNIVLEQRHANGQPDRLPLLAAELVRLKVDVIVTSGPTATHPAKQATSTIPIVMAFDDDPVDSGFVASQ
jgi:putative ABC transport system substrate-binding protein